MGNGIAEQGPAGAEGYRLKKRGNPEELLQTAIVDFVRRCCVGVMIFCSLNGAYLGGGNKAYVYMQKLKKLGLRSGEPDLRLHWRTSKTLFVECKIKPNKLTTEQANCMAELTAIGFPCELVHSLDEFIEVAKIHGISMRTRSQ